MRSINHALTGSLIGLTITNPVAAVSIALVSHFICDAIPHQGSRLEDENRIIKSAWFRRSLYIDAVLCFGLVLVLFGRQPIQWELAAICAFVATAPDLWWVNRYRLITSNRSWRPNLFSRFAKRIQWFQRPIGTVVEIVWFGAMVTLILPFLR